MKLKNSVNKETQTQTVKDPMTRLLGINRVSSPLPLISTPISTCRHGFPIDYFFIIQMSANNPKTDSNFQTVKNR